ncbi:MAG: methyltransferase domain-containing protein [Gemmataceae bacterium]|nr:methyltransferase domain-containing protein [Gemmataceae bacterium]
MSSAAEQANQRMVDRLIAEGALWSPRLIAAFRQTPRHLFLDRIFQYQRKHNRWREIPTDNPGPEELELIYSDRALITRLSPPPGNPNEAEAGVPISSSSQPSLMAQMLEDLRLSAGLRVLEVGAGTGYNAALLAHVVGSGLVWSLDVDRVVLAEARAHLQALPGREVRLCHADGREGWPEAAPFDRIMVTAATADLEPAWLEQLAEGGLCLAPLALAPGLAYLVRGTVRGGVLHGQLTRAAYFMPLRAEGESGESDTDVMTLPDPVHRIKAPWAGWFDRRRPRAQWLHFIQALAFYALLRGRNIHYRGLPDGQPVYGISAPPRDARLVEAVCWLGSQEWQVNGTAGRDLGVEVWRAFLNAGGPWPTEFRLRASPDGGLTTDHPEGYVRQGPRCRQVWELSEVRDRPGWV